VDFIGETVRAYTNGASGSLSPSGELDWAHDVLALYFQSAGAHPLIERARAEFEGLPTGDASVARVPYRRATDACPVTFDEFQSLMRRRRSVRWFEQRSVPMDLVDKALSVSFQAPSSCNRQPFRYRVFDEPAAVRAVMNMPLGTRGFADNVGEWTKFTMIKTYRT
jgi:hypothetical protein